MRQLIFGIWEIICVSGQGSSEVVPQGLKLLLGFTRIGEEERRDGEAIALHKTHIWANSLKPVCFLCFLLFWCPLLPFIETGTLKIYTKMVLYWLHEALPFPWCNV